MNAALLLSVEDGESRGCFATANRTMDLWDRPEAAREASGDKGVSKNDAVKELDAGKVKWLLAKQINCNPVHLGSTLMSFIKPCGWTIRIVSASGAELSSDSAIAALSSSLSPLRAAAAGGCRLSLARAAEGAGLGGGLDSGTGSRKVYLVRGEWPQRCSKKKLT